MKRPAFHILLATFVLMACQTTQQTATTGSAGQPLSNWTPVSSDASPLVDLSGVAGAEITGREERLYNVGNLVV